MDVSVLGSIDPGPGTAKIEVHRWSHGVLYEAERMNGTYHAIRTYTLAVVGVFQTTVGSVIEALAMATRTTIDTQRGATAILKYSLSYPDKNVYRNLAVVADLKEDD